MRNSATNIESKETGLKEKEKLLNEVFRIANVGICITDEYGKFEDVNDAYCRIYGYEKNELLGKDFTIVLPESTQEFARKQYDDFINGKPEIESEWEVVRKDGKIINIVVTAGLLEEEDKRRFKVTTVTDITKYKRSEKTIDYLSTHSSLTNLPYRAVFEDKLNNAVDSRGLSEALISVIMIDLDYFKNVNDTYGLHMGDELLKSVGSRINETVGDKHMVAYFGEDHYAVLIQNQSFYDEIYEVAEKIHREFLKPFVINNIEINISSSIGICVLSPISKDGQDLIRHAEKAILEAKKRGKNCVEVYTEELNSQLSRRLQLENDLKSCIKNNELFLVYQPQVCLKTGRMVGAEALLRWKHPSFGLVPPDEFISIAEETGSIISIGEWVLRTACAQAKKWEKAKLPFFKIAVNLSSVQLRQRKICENIKSILEETEVNPQAIELELTESSMMVDIKKSIEIFNELKLMGIKIAIDDFGTGYSSLNYLRKIPINKLKIDRSFIIDLNNNFESTVVTKTIIDMSKNLGFKVIAEGAETIEQISYLKHYGCDEVQGYYYSKPILPEEIQKFIER